MPDELAKFIGDALEEHPAEADFQSLRRVLVDESAEPGARLRVACVLTRLEPSSADSMRAFAAPLAEALIIEHPHTLSRWIDLLGPVAAMLVPPLRKVCRDSGRDGDRAGTAAEALTIMLDREDQQALLAQLTADATPEASHVLLRELVRLGPSVAATDALRKVLEERLADQEDEAAKDALAGPPCRGRHRPGRAGRA